MVSRLFENHRFKMPTNTLPGTGERNDQVKDEKNTKNMDNILTRNQDLNNQTINFQISPGDYDDGVDISDMSIWWDISYKFLTHVQDYYTSFGEIGQEYDNCLDSKFKHIVTSTDRCRSTLKPSQIIARDVTIHAAT